MYDQIFGAATIESSRRMAIGDVATASDDELCAAVVEVAVARAALDAFELAVLGELEAQGVCDRRGSKPTMWVAGQTRACRASVATRVKVARKLRYPFGQVADALAAGLITFDHAALLVRLASSRVIDDLADLQGELIDHAQDRPFAVWQSDLAQLVNLLDQDGGFDPERERARNHLHLNEQVPGEVSFSGTVVGADALVFTEAVRQEANRVWRRCVADHLECPELAIPSRATINMEALINVTRRGLARTDGTSQAPAVEIALVIRPDEPGSVFTLDGTRLPADRYAHLFCDAGFYRVVIDQVGAILDLGHTVRHANRAQRRAMAIRDGGCVFPGCDRPPPWCDAHHVVHWDDQGDTDTANMALLCRFHHGVTHRHGWTMTATADQRFVWHTAGGHILHSQRHLGRPPDT